MSERNLRNGKITPSIREAKYALSSGWWSADQPPLPGAAEIGS